jgi:hypothetical protein
MSAYQPKSPNLLHSQLFRKASADPNMVAGYMTGAIETTPRRKSRAVELEKRALARYLPRRCRKRLSYGERVERRMRKRMLGGSSALPDTLRHHFTEGERAVLCVVAGEIKRHGICDLTIDEIGDRAGVARTTVQNAMHEGRRLCLLKITERSVRGCKSKTNLVEIISHEWMVWIKRAPSAARRIGSTFKNASSSKNIGLDKRERIESNKATASNKQESFDETTRATLCRLQDRGRVGDDRDEKGLPGNDLPKPSQDCDWAALRSWVTEIRTPPTCNPHST